MKNAIEASNKPKNSDLGLLDKVKKRIENKGAQITQIEEEIAKLEALIDGKNAQINEETKNLQARLAELESQLEVKKEALSREVVNRIERKVTICLDEENRLLPGRDALVKLAEALYRRDSLSGRELLDLTDTSFVYDSHKKRYLYLHLKVADLRESFLKYKWSINELYEAGLMKPGEYLNIFMNSLPRDGDFLEIRKIKAEIEKRLKYSDKKERDEIAVLRKKLEDLSKVKMNDDKFGWRNFPKLSEEIEIVAIKAFIQSHITKALPNMDIIRRTPDDSEVEFWVEFLGDKGRAAKAKADDISNKYPVKKSWWHTVKEIFGGDARTLQQIMEGIKVDTSVEFFIELKKWIFKLRKVASIASKSPDKEVVENGLFYAAMADELEETYASLPSELETNLSSEAFDFSDLAGTLAVMPEIMKKRFSNEIRKQVEIAAEVHDQFEDIESKFGSPAPANDSQNDEINVRAVG